MSFPPVQVADVKKALIAAGFEIYRTRGTTVCLADRVRDNLIMDSGVAVALAPSLHVVLVMRAQRHDFPSEDAAALLQRARDLAAAAAIRGYREVGTSEIDVNDPADATRTLDTWYEVSFEKLVADLEEASREVAFALSLEKAARQTP